MNNSELAAVYEKAADVVRTNGHCKNWFYDIYNEGVKPRSDLRVCTVGALSLAVTGDPVPPGELDGTLREAVEYLSLRVVSATFEDDPIERIADWNDHADRTAGDVVDTLVLAAKAVA